MTTAIEQALKAAEQAGNQSTQALATAAAAPSGAVSTYAPPRKITTDDLTGGSMNVDGFIKFSDTGQVGVGDKWVESIKVSLALNEVVAAHGIRYGNPAQYIRTRDGSTTDKDPTLGAWERALETARRVDPKVAPYNAWDLPFTLLEKAGETDAGTRLGYTTVWSSFKAFHPVYVRAKEQFGENAVIELKISCVGVNKPGKKFGQAAFELIGEITPDE